MVIHPENYVSLWGFLMFLTQRHPQILVEQVVGMRGQTGKHHLFGSVLSESFFRMIIALLSNQYNGMG